MVSASERMQHALTVGADPDEAYCDPYYYEAEVAPLMGLSREARNRIFALEIAAKIIGQVADSDLSTDEIVAQVLELAENIEKDIERMVRTAELAEMPYHEYLQTPEWDERRKSAYARSQHRCQLCNRAAPLHAHHRTYERRGNEAPEDLVALCEQCHLLFHRYFDVN